jgi:uncharacterized protein YdeI (YjbR/CyaY-like superfamily)
MNPKIDEFLSKVKNWKEELETLRNILLDCGLIEELKWRQPCYMFQETNLILIGGFKEHCVISFFKGVLLSDTNGILVKPGENSQTVRFIKFTSVQEIVKMKPILKAYIYEAIEVEKMGLKVDMKESTSLIYPEEFQAILNKNPKLKKAFEALTPGRQRAYNMFFAAPKQSQTRTSRVEKYMQQILNGKGINDCTCGLSKKLPYCDGSHKFLKTKI